MDDPRGLSLRTPSAVLSIGDKPSTWIGERRGVTRSVIRQAQVQTSGRFGGPVLSGQPDWTLWTQIPTASGYKFLSPFHPSGYLCSEIMIMTWKMSAASDSDAQLV